jgi:hypothetical protein
MKLRMSALPLLSVVLPCRGMRLRLDESSAPRRHFKIKKKYSCDYCCHMRCLLDAAEPLRCALQQDDNGSSPEMVELNATDMQLLCGDGLVV